MAITKLISSGVSDQILHKFDITDKGVDTLMDSLNTDRFNQLEEISNNFTSISDSISSRLTPNVDSSVLEPLAGSKCPVY